MKMRIDFGNAAQSAALGGAPMTAEEFLRCETASMQASALLGEFTPDEIRVFRATGKPFAGAADLFALAMAGYTSAVLCNEPRDTVSQISKAIVARWGFQAWDRGFYRLVEANMRRLGYEPEYQDEFLMSCEREGIVWEMATME